jgi:nucleoside-diphosphate-sugar epimerase
MKVLLTGANGFIGRNFFKQYVGKYEFLCVDIADDIRKIQFDPSIDAVVHLGAYAGVRRSHEIPEEFWEMNVIGSERIFDEYYGVPIVYASSSSIYEWWLSPYATTKKVVETIAPSYTLGLRFHTVYGDDSRRDMIYDRLLRRDVEYITNHTRDWTHVFDVCSAIDVCLDNFEKMHKYRAIDVGYGKPRTVKSMADEIWPDNNLPVKEVTGEREHTCADPSILLEYGWKPEFG